jgi:hypothetical protein
MAGLLHEAHPAPRVFCITGVVLMIPAASLGGVIRERQVRGKLLK